MLSAGTKALELIEGQTIDDLEEDEIRTLALVRLLEIVGEAANGVSHEVQASYPDIRWAEIISLRNRLIHGYFFIDFGIVWRITTENLPPPVERLQELVADD
jgi:uncharacterized protein with HEPN domain